MTSRLAVLFTVALTGAPCVRNDPVAPGPDDPATRAFVMLVNDARRTHGCGELEWKDDVASVARRHSADMIERSFFDHTNPSGQSPFDRLKAAGIAYSLAGENILYGTVEAQRALDMWMNSAPHRANILTCGFKAHGVGRVNGHWTQLFITPPR